MLSCYKSKDPETRATGRNCREEEHNPDSSFLRVGIKHSIQLKGLLEGSNEPCLYRARHSARYSYPFKKQQPLLLTHLQSDATQGRASPSQMSVAGSPPPPFPQVSVKASSGMPAPPGPSPRRTRSGFSDRRAGGRTGLFLTIWELVSHRDCGHQLPACTHDWVRLSNFGPQCCDPDWLEV